MSTITPTPAAKIIADTAGVLGIDANELAAAVLLPGRRRSLERGDVQLTRAECDRLVNFVSARFAESVKKLRRTVYSIAGLSNLD